MLEQDLQISCERATINGASIMTRLYCEDNLLTDTDPVEQAALEHLRSCRNNLCAQGGNILGNYLHSDWQTTPFLKRIIDRKLVEWINKIHESIG